MNEFTPLVRPSQSQITIDAVAKECLSDGFNYPTFRQLAKNARLSLSKPISTIEGTTPYYRLFAIANSKSWFAAIRATPFGTGSELIFSPLDDLRSACEGAKANVQTLYEPKRALSIPTRANILVFACGDARLLVGLEDGSVIVYDTVPLLTPGNNDVQPYARVQLQPSSLRQILPNPGSEQGLVDVVAVVGDGKVHLLNTQLEPQGGWEGSGLMTQPIVVDWSPKGKHIAIGLQTGDILTFSLAKKDTPHKHFPPTFNSLLVSLNWLGPGHTFRTSYQAADGTPAQHIVVFDPKTSTATYYAPDHPFLCGDRKDQAAYVLSFPKWDVDSAASDESKSLTVVADFSSIDIEILGNIGNQWYRQMQESPLGLPLDADMNDTMILGFQADLTDPRYDSPIMYAYLNDGTVQGWYIEHTKPYVGMMNGKTFDGAVTTGMATDDKPKDGAMGGSAFGQASAPVSAFGQSSFGQQSASPFGGQTPSAFGQTSFGQQSKTTSSPFGSPTPSFGQTSFGQPSAFGAPAGGGFGQSSNTASPFKTPASGGFGSFAGGTGAFGSNTFGSSSTPSAFGGLGSGTTTNVFGQGSFGSAANNSSALAPPTQPEMTREASMSDSTTGFGGMSLGGAHPDSNATNSMFGSFSSTTPASTTTTSGFGGGSIVKPSSGAFGNFQTTSAFGATKLPETISAFAPINQASSTASPAFGQTGFGQPAFGQSSFGKTSFGAAPASGGFGSQSQKPAATSSGFSAFASAPTSFGSTTNNAPAKPAAEGGFSAFASKTPSAFGSAGNGSAFGAGAASPSQPATGGGFGGFASATPAFGSTEANKTTSVFGSTTTEAPFAPQPVFGSTAATDNKPRTSVFGTPTTGKSSFGNIRGESPSASPSKESLEISPPSSPEPKPSTPAKAASVFGQTTTPTTSSGGAFGNIQVSPSPFSALKPASGFGAFGGSTAPQNSAFFKKPDETPPPVSVFGSISTTPRTPGASASTPTFGSPSTLGSAKSVFGSITPTNNTTPTKTPASGGFGAFSGNGSGFGSFAGHKTSFTDLLKTGGDGSSDPVKPASVSVFSKPESPAESPKPAAPVSVFPLPVFASSDGPKIATPSKSPSPKSDAKEMKDEKKTGVKDEPSYGNLSASSVASSFVEVEGPGESDNEEPESGEVEEGELSDSFLSDLDESGYQDGDSANEESDDEVPEEHEERNTPSPELPPLPDSRSPSATPTPQAEVPTIEVSPSLDNEKEESSSPSPRVSPARESSTTPPSTPVKEQKPLFGQGSSLSTPGPSSSAPFSLGLGRPSTKPARSSPLANAVSADDEDDEKPKSPPAKALLTPISPRPVFGVLPTDDKASEKKDEAPAVSPKISNKRPKTPPLLSTMGPPPVPSAKSPVLGPADGSASTSSKPGPFSLGFGSSPANASAPSVFGVGKIGMMTPPKPDFQRAQTAPPAPTAASSPFGAPSTPGSGATSLFGGPPPTMKSPPAPSSTMPPFTLGGISTPTPGGSGFFGIKSHPAPQTPIAPPLFGGFGTPQAAPSMTSPFGMNQQPATPGKVPTPPTFGLGGFGAKPAVATPPKAAPAPSPPKPSPTAMMEEGMQKECLSLVLMMDDELAKLSELSKMASRDIIKVGKSLGGSRIRKELGDPTKWGLGDVKQFGKLMLQYDADLVEIEEHRKKQRELIRELHSSMLKCGTRKEEISRFQKARTDKEFAKMLKSRTLGPELTESQTRLRKDIRVIRDRVQKLESRLQENKKKLSQAATCKPTVKPPSLDTINRTYRNIELAIDQQTDQVARLASRISKINMSSTPSRASTPTRDTRLPDNQKPRHISPNVAAATAAALNAERSASRLKKALLAVRKEPLLNKQAVIIPVMPVPMSFETPNKRKQSSFTLPLSGSLFFEAPLLPSNNPSSYPSPAVTPSDVAPTPDWTLPEDNFNPTPIPETPLSSGRRVGPQRKHEAPKSFKRSPGAPSPASPPDFNWGPLPTYTEQKVNMPASFVSFSTPTKK